jgi:hypothetical protein
LLKKDGNKFFTKVIILGLVGWKSGFFSFSYERCAFLPPSNSRYKTRLLNMAANLPQPAMPRKRILVTRARAIWAVILPVAENFSSPILVA